MPCNALEANNDGSAHRTAYTRQAHPLCHRLYVRLYLSVCVCNLCEDGKFSEIRFARCERARAPWEPVIGVICVTIILRPNTTRTYKRCIIGTSSFRRAIDVVFGRVSSCRHAQRSQISLASWDCVAASRSHEYLRPRARVCVRLNYWSLKCEMFAHMFALIKDIVVRTPFFFAGGRSVRHSFECECQRF